MILLFSSSSYLENNQQAFNRELIFSIVSLSVLCSR